MTNKILKTVVAGIVATAIMSVVGFMAPIMGLPKMNPAELLAGMLGVTSIVGWMMHFIIGIIFAAAYVYLFNPKVRISNKLLKGALFGLIVFVFAQVMMFVMGNIVSMPMMESDMMPMMLGSLIGHLVYGIVVALLVPNYYTELHKDNVKTAHA